MGGAVQAKCVFRIVSVYQYEYQGRKVLPELSNRSIEDDAPDEIVETLRLVPNHIDASQLPNSGYVIYTLQTTLHDVLTADSAEAANRDRC